MLKSHPPAFGELPERMRSFLREKGVEAETPILPLKDGGNNQVYRLPGCGLDFVLKRYFQHPTDSRDRFNTERVFYDLLWSCGIRQIPEPLVWDEESHLGLFTFASGRKPKPEEISDELVGQALRFIIQINALKPRTAAQAISAASEAYFSVTEQVNCIARRVAVVQQIEPGSELDVQAAAFAHDELLPAWQETAADIARRCQSDTRLDQPLDLAQRCLSPSDFGFHNALLEETGKLRFLDFEYAGWDDPAKLICDFFCQPQVPVNFGFWEMFSNSFAAGLGGDTCLPLRAKMLLPAYQIKWCCIILNHFVTGGKARREFARGADAEEAKAGQLAKARRMLQNLHKLRD